MVMFIVKKVVSMLLMPVTMIIMLLAFSIAVGSRWPRAARFSQLTAIVLLVFVSSFDGRQLMLLPLEQQYSVNSAPITHQSCVVLVLGSGHGMNPQLPANQQLSSTALARLSEGLRQLDLGRQCQLVTSGWSGVHTATEPFQSHAFIAAKFAQQQGVPSERIVMQAKAKDTIEEAQWFKQRFGDTPFRLVTSASHMPRAMMIFASQGLQPEAAPTDYSLTSSGKWWRLSTDNMMWCQRAAHEYLGLAWLWLKQFLSI